MIRYDELLFNRFNEDWSNLPISKMLSLLDVKKQTTLPAKIDETSLNKKLNVKVGIDQVPIFTLAICALFLF